MFDAINNRPIVLLMDRLEPSSIAALAALEVGGVRGLSRESRLLILRSYREPRLANQSTISPVLEPLQVDVLGRYMNAYIRLDTICR